MATSFMHSVLGARKRGRTYDGTIIVQNVLPERATFVFRTTPLGRHKVVKNVTIEPGDCFTLDEGASRDFDYTLKVNNAQPVLVVRGGKYAVKPHPDNGGVLVEVQSLPDRPKGTKVSATPGLSFAFSGSGFLCVYQLGAAQCLQDQGIASNPYVRVVGCSGGAMTLFATMYGANLRPFHEQVKEMAQKIHKDHTQYTAMRDSMIKTLATFWRDGSLEHPAFKEGRVSVCYTATKRTSPSIALDALIGRAKATQKNTFSSPADAALSLLASGTIYFTGIPFAMSGDATQPEQKVADGGLVDNLPTIDEFSVTLKPFSAAWDLLEFSGATPDIAPTEYVPMRWGVLPPDSATLDHLFELGYRDMEAWLDENLDERLAKIFASDKAPLGETLPPVSFVCPDDGMKWHEEVLEAVPIAFRDQIWPKGVGKGRPSETSSEARTTATSASACKVPNGDGASDSATVPFARAQRLGNTWLASARSRKESLWGMSRGR